MKSPSRRKPLSSNVTKTCTNSASAPEKETTKEQDTDQRKRRSIRLSYERCVPCSAPRPPLSEIEPCFSMLPGQINPPKPPPLPLEHNSTLQSLFELVETTTKLCEIYEVQAPKYDEASKPIENLTKAFAIISKAIREYLSSCRVKEGAPRSSFAIEYIASQTTLINDELIKLVNEQADDMASVLGRAKKWPANLSTNPNDCIAHSINKVTIQSKEKHQKTHSLLGKNLSKGDRLEREGIFYLVARELQFSIFQNLCFAGPDRSSKLPWLLDFLSPNKKVCKIRHLSEFHEIASGQTQLSRRFHADPVIPLLDEERKEVIAAMRYYLHLTLSPLPYRKDVQAQWKKCRETLFGRIINKCRSKKTQKCWRNDSTRISQIPIRFKQRQIISILKSPDTSVWEGAYLSSQFTDVFGNNEPINEWNHPDIDELRVSGTSKINPMTIFGKCVKETIKAFVNISTEDGKINFSEADVNHSHSLMKFNNWHLGYPEDEAVRLFTSQLAP